MNTFKKWYVTNQDEITWFLLGLLFAGCLSSFSRGDYSWAVFDAVMFYANYKLRNVRLS
jgi:hypothetical protein